MHVMSRLIEESGSRGRGKGEGGREGGREGEGEVGREGERERERERERENSGKPRRVCSQVLIILKFKCLLSK